MLKKCKNMTNNIMRGFTLIELLAVIIVLAIIALIATPIILDVIDDARSEANKETVYGIIDAGRLYYAESMLDDTKKYNIENNINIYNVVILNGKKPETGGLYVNNDGQVSVSVVIDEKCYIKSFTGDLQELDTVDECSLAEAGKDNKIPTVDQIVKDLIIGSSGYYSDNLYIKINVVDNESGPKGYRKCISDSECEPSEEIFSVNEEILATNNNYVCVIGVDNNDNYSEKKCVNYKIDYTKPTATMTLINDNEGEIKIVVTASDLETNISRYEYSIDNGKTWQTNEENPSEYTYTGLDTGTYEILVRVTNGANAYVELKDSLVIIPEGAVVVESAEMLVSLMGKTANGYYFLTEDIDFTGVTWEPIYSFTGTLDGNGKTIKNFESTKGGLIDNLSGTVKNLNIENPNISKTTNSAGVIANKCGAEVELENINVLGGNISSTGTQVGGLIGETLYGLVINNSSSTIDVEGKQSVGGILGNSGSKNVTITNTYATGDVTATSMQWTGGLIGYLEGGTITNSYATGNVTSNSTDVGGLIGYLKGGTITNCYSTGIVTNTSTYDSYAGGLIGRTSGSNTINNSYATGDVNASGRYAGGLIGYSNSAITDSYATGNVKGGKTDVGGLVGYQSTGSISTSYATGNVTTTYLPTSVTSTYLGGLVGYNISTIKNCYATGNVTGSNEYNRHLGGLIGNQSYSYTVSNSYSLGKVTNGTDIDASIGYGSSGKITNVYFVTETSGLETSLYATPITDGGKTASSYVGFDFEKVWTIQEGVGYPTLR